MNASPAPAGSSHWLKTGMGWVRCGLGRRYAPSGEVRRSKFAAKLWIPMSEEGPAAIWISNRDGVRQPDGILIMSCNKKQVW